MNSRLLSILPFLIFIVVIFISGCAAEVCEKPYIMQGGKCCTDKDRNKICDKDETEVIHASVKKTETLRDETGEEAGEVNVDIEADVEVKTDCGGMDCFEEKFAECKPATVTSELMENIVYYYEIIGPKDGLCELKSKFTANPNPTWVGKEMTCKYDNTKAFNTAVQDMSKCQGQLYTLMTGG
jgi:hypothetical protein